MIGVGVDGFERSGLVDHDFAQQVQHAEFSDSHWCTGAVVVSIVSNVVNRSAQDYP